MPYALGRSREIVAIVFGDPLLSPPSEERSNKILWVSRRPAGCWRLALSWSDRQDTIDLRYARRQ